MKTFKLQSFLMLALLIFMSSCNINDQKQETTSSNDSNVISEKQVNENRIYRRAVEAAIWSQPLVGTHQTREAIRSIGGDYNSVAYLSQPGNWKWRVLTPNNQVLYAAIVTNTAIDGPMVIELPDSMSGAVIAGSILDSYQDPLVDVGLGGDDAGKGGKYLLFPAGDDSPVPNEYIPVRSERNIAWTMLRFVPKSLSAEDLAITVDVINQIKVYPLSEADNQPETHFVDAYDKLFDTVFPLDSEYYTAMASMLNEETVTDLDKSFINLMGSFGYEPGKEFNPAAETKVILDQAIKDAAMELVYGVSNIAKPFWDGTQWKPLGREPTFSTGFSFITANELDYDLRGTMYSYVCCGGVKLGASTNLYLQSNKDKNGVMLDGGKHYKVTVPKDAPTNQFWSFMAYDALTAVYFEDVERPGLSSFDAMQNADGSTDIYFGPTAPKGKESNWIPTKEDSNVLLLFRLYGSTPQARDGSWVLPSLELMN